MSDKKSFEAANIPPLYTALDNLSKIGRSLDSDEVIDTQFVRNITWRIDFTHPETGLRYETAPDWLDYDRQRPNFLLNALRSTPNLRGRSPETTSKNIRLAAEIGCVALERLVMRTVAAQKLLSKTTLRDVQRTFRHVGEQSALAMASSDLPRKHAAEEIWAINRLVNPNSRVVQSWERRYGLGKE
jgi:hypothetical protein